ncbi:hypothetical protein H0H87_008840 [Tephrocybe sp. NHM501043]|nr:hypothetical protein H0H87_008840 [Tephrocybe sp. NHM501043]
MPAIKASPSSKRGVPKQKGAIRAKSGCYTCRIRRKKCDEQPDNSGRCMTCVRLRLECLGFGAKRPDWLRESRNVAELREKIKAFLAAQGMIKGHSGTCPRGVEPEQPTLNLSADGDYSSSSESPPTPTLSLTDPSRPHHMISSIRDDHFAGENEYSTSTTPALISSFGELYTNFVLPEDFHFIPAASLPRNPEHFVQPYVDAMLNHYRERVVKAQYLFADNSVRNLICEVVLLNESSGRGASLLSSVHWQRFKNPDAIAFQSQETQDRLRELQNLLDRSNRSSGDAMAALHVVSSYLFDGGCGEWEEWLNVSHAYVDNIFAKYPSPWEALLRCGPKDVFIIKTSIWFDVLASVTTLRIPHFLNAIRDMFDPRQSKITELDAEDPSSMMSPMGCHNQVVWALAEASALYNWKMIQQRTGCLSVPLLVQKAMEIEEFLQPPPLSTQLNTDIGGCRVLASEIFRASARLYLRAVVSGDHPNVPEIEESVQDTITCMERLNLYPCNSEVHGQTMSRSVVRNTVFGFFICGAFAERAEHREVIRNLLDREGNEPGNCGSIRRLLIGMWHERDDWRTQHPRAVDWRNVLLQAKILLV